MNSRTLATGLAAALLLLTACSDGGQDVAAPPPPAESCPGSPDPGESPIEVGDDLTEKPEIEIPEGASPPDTLQVVEVVDGDGQIACAGDSVAVQYVGALYSDGTQFDASWDRGEEPFTFTLGGGQVIAGWDQGLVGMRQGGRRLLVIPPDLGYGERGAGADIPPGATLVFVVDLIGVTDGETEG